MKRTTSLLLLSLACAGCMARDDYHLKLTVEQQHAIQHASEVRRLAPCTVTNGRHRDGWICYWSNGRLYGHSYLKAGACAGCEK